MIDAILESRGRDQLDFGIEMEDQLFNRDCKQVKKPTGVVPKLEAIFSITKERLIPARIKLRPFIGEDMYLALINKVVEFNEGIELKNYGFLDSL